MLKIPIFILSPFPISKCVHNKLSKFFSIKQTDFLKIQAYFLKILTYLLKNKHIFPKPKGIFTKTELNYFLFKVKQQTIVSQFPNPTGVGGDLPVEYRSVYMLNFLNIFMIMIMIMVAHILNFVPLNIRIQNTKEKTLK